MDDVLRPKTVPLSAETILWFEFLLNPSLLNEHLAKSNASPSPIDLVSKFLSIVPENQTNSNDITTPDIESAMNKDEGLKIGRKQLAIKILGLKVASHLKWNLEVLEKNLTMKKQVQLLSDLCTVTSGKLVTLPLSLVHECTIGPEGSKQAFNFALTQYHRWVLRAQVLKEIPPKIPKQGFGHVLVTHDQTNAFRDEIFVSSLEPFTQTSIDFLNQMCESEEPFLHLTVDSFVALNQTMPTDRLAQNFNCGIRISKPEFKAQVCFDLCRFYLHEKKYQLAKENIIKCRKNYELTREEYRAKNSVPANEFLFCTFSETELQGCVTACGVAENVDTGLLLRMNESLMEKYKVRTGSPKSNSPRPPINHSLQDICEILKEDNAKNEISLVNRRILELDLQAAISSKSESVSPELAAKVTALNTIKSIIDNEDLFGTQSYHYTRASVGQFSNLIEAATDYLPATNKSNLYYMTQRTKVKSFLRDVWLTMDEQPKPDDLATLQNSKFFSPEEIADINHLKAKYTGVELQDIELPVIATGIDWKMGETKNTTLEIGGIKRQIISCTTAATIRKLLVKLAKTLESNQSNQLEPWHINPSWAIPIPIKSILMSLQRGFFQDFAYILIAKSTEMVAHSKFKQAMAMMTTLKNETQRPEFQNSQAITKLGKLIEYELLLFQITQTLEEWPQTVVDNAELITRCKQCISAAQHNELVVPRGDILDACAAMLLNLNETTVIALFEKRYPSSELYTSVASSLIELEHQKTNAQKKVCRDAWDLILPMFISNNPVSNNKRNSIPTAGPSASTQTSQGVPALVVRSNLWPFLKKLRDIQPISIVLSLLSRLHNILDDESSMELNMESMHLWPTTISNASVYNIEVVSETLHNLLKQGLQYHPQYGPWIRLKGDLEYRAENFEVAMSCYVSAILAGSEYCTVNLQRQIDDYIVRRMIKCSSSLGCSMQAAILCQCLEEIDYSLAFKTFSDRGASKPNEKTPNYTDAMDSYYNYIWDPTLMEFIINLQNKRGEHKRKQLAIASLGQLELNANNTEEIRREAASIRKTRFFRCLAKQYVL